MRKFADKQTKNKEQSSGSNTEATLILCGYSGERANSSNTEATLIPCGSSGERANNYTAISTITITDNCFLFQIVQCRVVL